MMKRFRLLHLAGSLAGIALLHPVTAFAADEKKESDKDPGEVNLYTHRHYESDEVIFSRFTEETGIKINVVKAGADELIERLKSEGSASPADLLITADAGRLVRAKDAKLLQPISSEGLEANVPENLRDPEGYWFALTRRARILAYAKDRIDPSELSTYEALADPIWRGRVIARSSSNIYNQSLLASIIANVGEEKATEWATAVRKNMARPPQGSDRDQMRAVAAGLADVAIVNTYYLGLLINSTEKADQKVGQDIGVFFPNQEGRGAHINISGAGVTKSSKNKENAIRLLEYLVDEKQQASFASANHEYPVNPNAEWSPLLTSWGAVKADELNLSELGKQNAAAVQAFDKAGWE